jgi:hypothetical protein
MTNEECTPQPFTGMGLELPEELLPLVEELAKNVHEVWSQGRISDGWTYGKVRNDTLRQHPCLVPYEQLPESEKDYDRHTAIATIQFILQQGFTITKK